MKKYIIFLFIQFAIWGCKKNDFKQISFDESLTFTVTSNHTSPSSLLVLKADKNSENDSVSIQFGSLKVSAYRLDSSRFGLLVPILPAGTYNLNLSQAGGQDSLSITIDPYLSIENPEVFINTTIEVFQRKIDSLSTLQDAATKYTHELQLAQQINNQIKVHINKLSKESKMIFSYFIRHQQSNLNSLVGGRYSQFKPSLRTAEVTDSIVVLKEAINSALDQHIQIENLNLQLELLSQFWKTSNNDIKPLLYLLSLETYVQKKIVSQIIHEKLSTYAYIADGELSNRESMGTANNPVKVVRNKFIVQAIQARYRTIQYGDISLFDGKVDLLYHKVSLLESFEKKLENQWKLLKNQFSNELSSIDAPYATFLSKLPILPNSKIKSVPYLGLSVSNVSQPDIKVTITPEPGGLLKLHFNTTNMSLSDGLPFSFTLSYNQPGITNQLTLTENAVLEHYASVAIDGKIWMQDNLDVSVFLNGDSIPFVGYGPTWATLKTPAWCYYNNDPATAAIYGFLYNYYAISDPRGLAPSGWHIASVSEWTSLISSLGGRLVAGGKMKAVSPLWNAPNTDATNNSGFSALPGGRRGNGGTYVNRGVEGVWWTADEYGPNGAWIYTILFNDASCERTGASKQDGFSIRCIKD